MLLLGVVHIVSICFPQGSAQSNASLWSYMPASSTSTSTTTLHYTRLHHFTALYNRKRVCPQRVPYIIATRIGFPIITETTKHNQRCLNNKLLYLAEASNNQCTNVLFPTHFHVSIFINSLLHVRFILLCFSFINPACCTLRRCSVPGPSLPQGTHRVQCISQAVYSNLQCEHMTSCT